MAHTETRKKIEPAMLSGAVVCSCGESLEDQITGEKFQDLLCPECGRKMFFANGSDNDE